MCGSPTYKKWNEMVARCNQPTNAAYPRYGARGIAVCERWRDFENFLADMGEKPGEGFSLDRYPDGDGNYEPGNCRWATRTEQHRNKSSNRLLTAFGRTQCLTSWAEEFNIDYRTLRSRIDRGGMAVETALTAPLQPGRRS